MAASECLKEVLRSDGKRIKAGKCLAFQDQERKTSPGSISSISLMSAPTNSYRVIFDDPASEPHPPGAAGHFRPAGGRGKSAFLCRAGERSRRHDPGAFGGAAAGPGRIHRSGRRPGALPWTPAIGQAGQYGITFTASDGLLKTSQKATVTICAAEDTDCDGTGGCLGAHLFRHAQPGWDRRCGW